VIFASFSRFFAIFFNEMAKIVLLHFHGRWGVHFVQLFHFWPATDQIPTYTDIYLNIYKYICMYMEVYICVISFQL